MSGSIAASPSLSTPTTKPGDLGSQLENSKVYTFSTARRVDILNGKIDKKPRVNLQLRNCRSFTKEDAERFPNSCTRVRPGEHLLLDYTNPNTRGFIVPLKEVLRNRIPLT
jgi:hypothetical protein